MKIGIYGGSFNPVHFGHTGLAQWVATHCGLDEVWLMVSPANPLKSPDILADEQERVAGVRRAIAGMPRLRVCDIELHLPRPSYTADTLRALALRYPEHDFTLIIGEDNLTILTRWREWEYIVARYPILVYPRGRAEDKEVPPESLAALDTARRIPGARIRILEGAPLFHISSTEIRAKNNSKSAK
ncbi:MAG: nicotinate (nicotinamide) nucleotide adenylyltransferase [Paludibacteraceae bacterium]|nr:nicotinate (nicotinamide) nucleotide adenylyltransferase [Paludibacteraceae bacterium]